MPETYAAWQRNGSQQETLRSFYCSGCGRRLFQYDQIGSGARIQVRCRDCKTESELRGADIPKLLQTLSEGGRV